MFTPHLRLSNALDTRVRQKNCSHQVVKHLLCHQLLLWVSWRVLCPHPGDYIFINGPFFRWAGWWVGWIHYKKEDQSSFWFCNLSVIWGKVPEFRLAHRKFSELWCLEIWKFDVLQLATVSHHLDPRKLGQKERVDQNDRPQDEGIEHGDSRILWIIFILPLAFNGSSSSWVFSVVLKGIPWWLIIEWNREIHHGSLGVWDTFS